MVFAAIWEYMKYTKYLPRQTHSNRKVNVTQLRFRYSAAGQGWTKGAPQLYAAKQSVLISYRPEMKLDL